MKSVAKSEEKETLKHGLSDNRYLERVGIRIRRLRKKQGLSRRRLAGLSGVSERYLAQIETGTGNISILLLRQIARALNVVVEELSSEKDIDIEAVSIISALREASPENRANFLHMFDEWQQAHGQVHQRIALIGLRGAGKSTLGFRVAQQLDIPFLEINEEIERECGMKMSEILGLYGEQGYRKLAQRSIAAIKAKHNRVILAVAGGMLVESEIFESLLSAFHTVWLRADPEDHMLRVQQQGDDRPMAGHPEAMRELKQILETRGRHYERARMSINTSGKTISQSHMELVRAVKSLLI
ncbi:MAG: helix-turn-helix transcriptional regulator [Pseudomonadota bacterium]